MKESDYLSATIYSNTQLGAYAYKYFSVPDSSRVLHALSSRGPEFLMQSLHACVCGRDRERLDEGKQGEYFKIQVCNVNYIWQIPGMHHSRHRRSM